MRGFFFDAGSEDSIDIQEKIAFEIASLLDTAMDPAEIRLMVAAGTESITAWEAYVRMRELYYRSIDEFEVGENSAPMLELYEQVVAQCVMRQEVTPMNFACKRD